MRYFHNLPKKKKKEIKKEIKKSQFLEGKEIVIFKFA